MLVSCQEGPLQRVVGPRATKLNSRLAPRKNLMLQEHHSCLMHPISSHQLQTSTNAAWKNLARRNKNNLCNLSLRDEAPRDPLYDWSTKRTSRMCSRTSKRTRLVATSATFTNKYWVLLGRRTRKTKRLARCRKRNCNWSEIRTIRSNANQPS